MPMQRRYNNLIYHAIHVLYRQIDVVCVKWASGLCFSPHRDIHINLYIQKIVPHICCNDNNARISFLNRMLY